MFSHECKINEVNYLQDDSKRAQILELLLHDIRKKCIPYKEDLKNMHEFETNIQLD